MNETPQAIAELDPAQGPPSTPAHMQATRTSIVQREAIRLLALGWTEQRVADALGLSRMTLGRWRETPEWTQAVERFNTGADETVLSVREQLQLGAMRMLNVILGIAEAPDAKHGDKQNAADSWLDRAGYPRIKAEFGKMDHIIRAEPGFWERFNTVKAEAMEHTNGDP